MKNISVLFLLLLMFSILKAQNPPQSISATVTNSDVLIEWTAPIDGILSELTWSGNTNNNAIGLSNGGSFAIAARWEPSMISQYDGAQIHQVSFFPNSSNSTYTLKIWKGSNAVTLVYSQMISTFISEEWNTITLNNTVIVDGNSELWIGIEISHPENEFPAGVDEGPAIAGFGDLINLQGVWETISSYGLDQNFNLKAILVDSQGRSVSLTEETIAKHDYKNNGTLNFIETEPSSAPILNGTNEIPDAYKLFRNQQLITSTAALSYSDQGLSNGIYTYAVSAVYGENESSSIQTTAQIGTPSLSISPDPFIDTLPIDQYVYREIVLSNTGNIDLNWQVQSNSYDINVTTYQGTIAPGTTQSIEIIFNTYGFIGGTYIRNLSFTTNDINLPAFNYPLQFTIVAAPVLFLPQNTLNFGDIVAGQSVTRQFRIQNVGYGTLVINNISVDNASFTISNDLLEIAPFQYGNLMITFSPDSVQTYNGSLSFNTNAIGSSNVTIPLSGSGIVPSPLYLTADIINNKDVQLIWAPSSGNNGSWISYCTDNYNTSIGIAAAGSFTIAARWPVGSLQDYEGQSLIKAVFFPTSSTTTYILKIWQGPQASNLIHSQIIQSFQTNQWNEVEINNLIVIDPSQELWLGFEMNQPDNEFPAAVDEGPSAYGLGDMVNLGENWTPLSDFGFLNNWLIKGFVSDPQTSQTYELPVTIDLPLTNSAHHLISKTFEINNVAFNETGRSTPDFLGYNVYRNGSLLNNDLIQEINFLDEGLDFGTYEYGVTSVYDLGESIPKTDFVQFGGPVLAITPDAINDSIEAGETSFYELFFSNTGVSELNWTFVNLPYNMTASSNSGSLTSNQSAQITLNFNPQGFLFGNYNVTLLIATNNVNEPITEIPVNIVISSDLMITFNSDTLHFGMAPLGQQIIRPFKVFNNGNLPVYVFSAHSNTINFQPYVQNSELNPGDSINIIVSFQGNIVGPYDAMLSVEVYSQGFQLFEQYQIPMTAFVSLPPPSSLTASVSNDTVQLNWYPPGITPGILQYGAGESMSAIGYSAEGVLEAAARFGPAELMPFDGQVLSQVGFYTWSNLSTFKIKVYSGENAEILLLEQNVDAIAETGWNNVILNTPIPIVSNNWLWIGYEMTQSEPDFGAGIDAGPAVSNKGEMVSLNGGPWQTLSYYGLSYNWNIRGLLTDNNTNNKTLLSSGQSISRNAEPMGELVTSPIKIEHPTQKQVQTSVNGYNVYRDGLLLTSQPVQTIEFLDILTGLGSYLYEVTAVYDQGESIPASVMVDLDSTVNMPEGWEFTKTAFVHNIYIPEQAAMRSGLNMIQGDAIGVFFNYNGQQVCAGSIVYENVQMLLRAYGDNSATPEKDGFNVGDLIYWKAHLHTTNQTYNLYVSYDFSMPQADGLFQILGLSMLSSMETGIVGIDEDNEKMKVNIFPNPNSGTFTIAGLQFTDQLSIFDITGRLVDLPISLQEAKTFTLQTKGVYLIEIRRNNDVLRKKLIVR